MSWFRAPGVANIGLDSQIVRFGGELKGLDSQICRFGGRERDLGLLGQSTWNRNQKQRLWDKGPGTACNRQPWNRGVWWDEQPQTLGLGQEAWNEGQEKEA